MFNIKTMGIAFSVLALVGLIGALMAGPAFAGKPDKGSGAIEITHRTDICHYNGYEDAYSYFEGDTEVFVDAVDGSWEVKMVDDDSLDTHLGLNGKKAHGFGGNFDQVIDDSEFPVAGTVSTDDCMRRAVQTTPDLDV